MTTPLQALAANVREEWREVPRTDGRYFVSNYGRVRGPSGRVTLGHPNPWRGGYLRVTLRDKPPHRTRRMASVHVLVAEAFHGPRPDGYDAAHMNGDKTDNRIWNVAYVTRNENAWHRKVHGTQKCGGQLWNTKLTTDIVRRIRADGRSSAVIAKELGIHPGHVRKVRKGRAWEHVK